MKMVQMVKVEQVKVVLVMEVVVVVRGDSH